MFQFLYFDQSTVAHATLIGGVENGVITCR